MIMENVPEVSVWKPIIIPHTLHAIYRHGGCWKLAERHPALSYTAEHAVEIGVYIFFIL